MPILSPEELEQKLDEIVRRLRDALDPVAIYFFGSYAYGTPQSHSDIDLRVVAELWQFVTGRLPPEVIRGS
jgi:predicted nucleotidyltransferase